jgi:hypothetical protein
MTDLGRLHLDYARCSETSLHADSFGFSYLNVHVRFPRSHSVRHLYDINHLYLLKPWTLFERITP